MRHLPCRLAPLLIAVTVAAAPVRAADRPARAAEREGIVAVPVQPPVVVPPVVAPVAPVVVALPFRDPRTGRCLAGFVLNMAGACVRPDDPLIVCGAPPDGVGPDICGVAPPDPAPYGIGANLRLNY